MTHHKELQDKTVSTVTPSEIQELEQIPTFRLVGTSCPLPFAADLTFQTATDST